MAVMRSKDIPVGNAGQTVRVYYDAQGKMIAPESAMTPEKFAQAQQTYAQTQAQNPAIARPGLRTASQLANRYGGITFNEQDILRRFNKATRDEYAALRRDYRAAETAYGRRLSEAQSAALDAIRKSNAEAIATGASRGMMAANELSAMLGIQQTGAETATELAQEAQRLSAQEQAALSDNVTRALETSNAIKQALGTLDANLYAQDTLAYSADVGAKAQLEAMLAQMEGQRDVANIQGDAQRDSATIAAENARYIAELEDALKRDLSDVEIKKLIMELENRLKVAEISRPVSGGYNYNYQPTTSIPTPGPIADPGLREQRRADLKAANPTLTDAQIEDQLYNEEQREAYYNLYNYAIQQGDLEMAWRAERHRTDATPRTYEQLSRDLYNNDEFQRNHAAAKFGIRPDDVVDNVSKITGYKKSAYELEKQGGWTDTGRTVYSKAEGKLYYIYSKGRLRAAVDTKLGSNVTFGNFRNLQR